MWLVLSDKLFSDDKKYGIFKGHPVWIPLLKDKILVKLCYIYQIQEHWIYGLLGYKMS